MEIVHTVLVILLLLCSAIMTFFILLQEGKGGGLTAMQGTRGGNIEGVTNPVRRATVFVAAIWLVSAIILAILARGEAAQVGDALFNNQTAKQPGVEVIPVNENKPPQSIVVPPAGIKPGTAPVSATVPIPNAPTLEVDPKKAPGSDVKTPEAPKTDAPKVGDALPVAPVSAPAVAPKAGDAPPAVTTPAVEAPKAEAPKAEEKKDAAPVAPATK